VYFFFIFYPIYHDLLQTRRYVYIIPGIYALWALSVTGYAVLKNYQEDKNQELFHERLWIFIAVVFWCTQPLVGAFGGAPKWIVGIFGNINFLVLNALFMHQTIKRTKADYQRLQESNTTLTEKVTEGTRKIKKLAKEIEHTFNDQLTEYINKHGITDELDTVKGNINKITFDMVNLFNLERFVTVNAIKGASSFDFNPKEEAAINKFEQSCQAYSLTSRETNIAKLVCQGFSYKIIGENLFIAERTVKKHVQNIFRKVNVSNKIQLINKLET
jgi:DNA-binding CsgD family transcriptional regulator